jgi:hypothetical protein
MILSRDARSLQNGARATLWLTALHLIAVAACSSSDSDPEDDSVESFCAVLEERGRSCGALSAGRLGGCVTYGDAAERCEARCLTQASCDAVETLLCTGLGSAARCLDECIGLTVFACADGTTLPPWSRCDGQEECSGAEDEAGCSSDDWFKCRNVDQTIDRQKLCDDVPDCSDESDEVACAPVLTCDGSVPVGSGELCDGYSQCTDGSDEPEECAIRQCGSR